MKQYKNLGIRTYETLYESYVLLIINYTAGVWAYSEYFSPQVLQNRGNVFIWESTCPFQSAMALEFGWLDVKFQCWLKMARFLNRVKSISMTKDGLKLS